jgi:hypothetical protein
VAFVADEDRAAVLTFSRHSPQMIDSSALSPGERGDLLAFLESL